MLNCLWILGGGYVGSDEEEEEEEATTADNVEDSLVSGRSGAVEHNSRRKSNRGSELTQCLLQ